MLRDELLRALSAEPDQCVAFDADGTLWTHDIGCLVFEFALASDALLPPARSAMEQLLHRIGAAPGPDWSLSALGASLSEAATRGQLDGRSYAEMQVWCYAGMSPEELRELAREALREGEHQEGLRAPLRELLTELRRAGARTIVVSASPRILVEEATDILGFHPADVTGGDAIQDGEVLGPALLHPLPYGPRKAEEAARLSASRPLLAAFGDSDFDLDLLRAARIPVGLGERQALRTLLSGLPGSRWLTLP